MEKFTRPLNIENLKEKVREYGNVDLFWMDKIRSFCYVVYKKKEHALNAMEGLQGFEFQPSLPLVVKLKTRTQVEKGMEESSANE